MNPSKCCKTDLQTGLIKWMFSGKTLLNFNIKRKQIICFDFGSYFFEAMKLNVTYVQAEVVSTIINKEKHDNKDKYSSIYN